MVASVRPSVRSRKTTAIASALLVAALVPMVPGGQAEPLVDCDGALQGPCAFLGSVGFGDICIVDRLLADFGIPPSCPADGVAIGARIGLEYYESSLDTAAGVVREGTIDVVIHVANDGSTPYRLVTPTAKAAEVDTDVWVVHFPASKNHGYFVLEVLSIPEGANPSFALNILPDRQSPAEYTPNLANSHAGVLFQ